MFALQWGNINLRNLLTEVITRQNEPSPEPSPEVLIYGDCAQGWWCSLLKSFYTEGSGHLTYTEDPAMEEARRSATMVFTLWSRNISVSAQEGK